MNQKLKSIKPFKTNKIPYPILNFNYMIGSSRIFALCLMCPQGWQAFCYAAMAPMDSAHQMAAANYVKGKKPQELVGGTGAASTLLFIYANT